MVLLLLLVSWRFAVISKLVLSCIILGSACWYAYIHDKYWLGICVSTPHHSSLKHVELPKEICSVTFNTSKSHQILLKLHTLVVNHYWATENGNNFKRLHRKDTLETGNNKHLEGKRTVFSPNTFTYQLLLNSEGIKTSLQM